MAASLIGWIWQQSIEKDLSTGARLTLFALAEHTNLGEHGDWRVFPSQNRLAAMVGCSDFTLRKHMKELSDAGVLTYAHQYDDDGRQRSNLYWLMAPKLFSEGGKKLSGGGERNLPQEGQETCDKPLNKEPLNKNIGRFTPPTPKQVSEYASEKGYIMDSERFCDFYASKGWMVGKNKMKDWKAAVRNWNRGKTQETSQQEGFII